MSLTVAEYFGKTPITGSVGIELEVEHEGSYSIPAFAEIPGWAAKRDGSLNNGVEYVLTSPIGRTPAALNKSLSVILPKLPSNVIRNAYTSSTHVHLNASRMTLVEVASASTLWWLVEPYVTEDCGDERKTNRYAQPFNLEKTLGDFRGLPLHYVADRYSALNLAATKKFLSIEYRSMRSCLDKDMIIKWVRLLSRLQYDVAMKHKSPLHVLERFANARDKKAYIEKIVGGLVTTPLTDKHVEEIEDRYVDLYEFACLPGQGKTWDEWQEDVKQKVSVERSAGSTVGTAPSTLRYDDIPDPFDDD